MKSRRILLIDDEAVLRSAFAEALTAHGHHVTEASTAAEAEGAFIEERNDVVITDLRLPDGCGLDLLTRLRALDTRFAAIVTTGYGTYAQAVEAIRLRVSAFLSKPFSVDELIRIIAELDTPVAAEAKGLLFEAAAQATEKSIVQLTQQIESELDRLQARPWVRVRALELLCEALENVVTHAYLGGPGTVDVAVGRDGEGLLLKINDRGRGFDASEALAGVLRELNTSVAGGDVPGLLKFHRDADEVRVDSAPGEGTRIQLRFRNAFDGEFVDLTEVNDDSVAVACLWS